MIITESRWRKWLFLPYISVQPEWVEELCVRREVPIDVVNGANWTGLREEYRWTEEVHDWLFESGGRWSLERCGGTDDFRSGTQARIWFRHMKNVTMFKLTFGGRERPKDLGPKIKMTKQTVKAKSRKLKATWSLEPPTVIRTFGPGI